MGRRLTRKQIRKDEFISLVDRGIHWFGGNWRQATIGLAGMLLLALVYWGVTALIANRTEAASEAMARALEVYSAPVGATAPADAKVRFGTDAERLTAAEKAFEQVKSRYYLTTEARIAGLYLAHIAVDRGDSAQAIRALGEIASRRSADPVVRLAMLDLVRLRIARGDGPQLAKELDEMATGRDPRLPRDVALFELGKVWEHEGKPEEAAKVYRKLVEDFPESAYRSEAQQRLLSVS